MPGNAVISIVDNDISVREAVLGLMRATGFIAESFHSAEHFLRAGGPSRASCLIADMRMPGMSGLELQNHLAAAGTPIPTILITAFPDERDRECAKKNGAVCYLTKPFKDADLLACIEASLATSGSPIRK
ncbi:MAG TPA: response regulator [Acidisoma sp.]|jgi:FixJ family two-component response regulator|uniref:response regulator transcription factor n=1 Tax=Acidisoma sp. TaxID=1872115 RepID=UPI002BDDF700|nr:response regulator [Acidisoma sp.]HTI01739.1 response regulator [Acidisoma sp.]